MIEETMNITITHENKILKRLFEDLELIMELDNQNADKEDAIYELSEFISDFIQNENISNETQKKILEELGASSQMNVLNEWYDTLDAE